MTHESPLRRAAQAVSDVRVLAGVAFACLALLILLHVRMSAMISHAHQLKDGTLTGPPVVAVDAIRLVDSAPGVQQ